MANLRRGAVEQLQAAHPAPDRKELPRVAGDVLQLAPAAPVADDRLAANAPASVLTTLTRRPQSRPGGGGSDADLCSSSLECADR